MFNTIKEIAQDFVNKLGVGDLDLIQYSSDVHAETLMKRHIRNHYGLWTDNPLTELWRTEPELRHIKDGIDYSPDHPDQVSELILQRVYKIVKGEE